MVGKGLIGAVMALMAWANGAEAACRDDKVQLRGAFGQASFAVEIADDDGERAQGLMHRPTMPRFAGMLFVFDRPERAVFWMENTLIPLDMLFIDSTGTVQQIHRDAVPMDRTAIDGGSDVLFVLEINGGMAARLGLQPGDQIRHPAVAQDTAAWTCE